MKCVNIIAILFLFFFVWAGRFVETFVIIDGRNNVSHLWVSFYCRVWYTLPIGK